MLESQKQTLQIIVISGAVLFGLSRCNPLQSARQCMTQSFKTVSGTIVKVHADETNPSVDYRYTVAGKAYRSSRFSFVATDPYFEFDAVIGDKQPGDAIDVLFDSENPERSVLLRGLSTSASFCLIWLVGVSLGSVVLAFRLVNSRQSTLARKQKLFRRAEFEEGVLRLRMVPCNLTPVTAGIACFAAVTAITLVGLAVVDWGPGWWQSSLATKVAVSLVVGSAAGVFDYRYTLMGNRRGRWDLIIDLNRQFVQLPAMDAYGQPTTVNLDHAVDVSVSTHVKPCDEQDGIYHATLDCYEEKELGDAETSVRVPRRWKHPFAMSSDREDMVAMADFLRDALGFSGQDSIDAQSSELTSVPG